MAPIALDTEGSSWEGSIIFTQVAERLGGMPLFRKVVLGRTAKFDNPAYVETGAMLQSLVKDGAFNSDFASESDPHAQTLFESGKAAMWDMGDWDVATMWPLMHNNLGWFPFPSIRGGKGNGAEVGTIFNTNTTPWDDALGTALGENFDDATANILGGQSPASALAEVDQYAKQLG